MEFKSPLYFHHTYIYIPWQFELVNGVQRSSHATRGVNFIVVFFNPNKCAPDISILAGHLSAFYKGLPLIKVLLGSERQARLLSWIFIFWSF